MINSTFIPIGSHGDFARSRIADTNQSKIPIPIVLIHGWGCDASVWQSLMPFLNKYADIITLDIRYSYKNVDTYCEAIVKHLPAACILCGWSLGGMLAMRLAGLYPLKIKGLITLATNLKFVADKHWPHAMEADVFDEFFEAFALEPKKTLRRFALLQVKDDADSKKQLAYLKRHSTSDETLPTGLNYLSSIDNTKILSTDVVCPTLLFFGEKDTLVPLSAANKITQLVSAHQEVVIISGKGHVLLYVDNLEMAGFDVACADSKNMETKNNNALLLRLHNFLEKLSSSFYQNLINQ
jgi:malonyl-CoA O-methyltransferase